MSSTQAAELALQASFLASLLATAFLAWRAFRPRNQHSLRSVAILVLGDIGRSPRMMYHAQSFAENGFVTHLIGYGGAILLSLRSAITQCSDQPARLRPHSITRTPSSSNLASSRATQNHQISPISHPSPHKNCASNHLYSSAHFGLD
jgi:hypothetical protein